MDNLGFVRPDIVLLKTANRAEHCSVALTQNGEVCGALTRVHRVQPMGGRAVCYTAAINRQELITAIKLKKTDGRIINNSLYVPMKSWVWAINKSQGMPEFFREFSQTAGATRSHCDISMLNCKLPVFCLNCIKSPIGSDLCISYNKRPYTEDKCILLGGSLLYRQEQEARAQGIEDWKKDRNLIYFEGYSDPTPPYAYNPFNVVAHEDRTINFSEMLFRKEHKVIKDNPFIIYVDWSRMVTTEALYAVFKQGYDRCTKSMFSKPKKPLEEYWRPFEETPFTFTQAELMQIKPLIDRHNQEIMSRFEN